MTDQQNKALYIAEQCRRAGMTLAGAAGVIANVEAESVFRSDNLQDCYNSSLKVSDQDYTAQVDAGARNFIDSAGYGLCQWTSGDRKDRMLRYHRERCVSIGDFHTQVDFLIYEMRTFYRSTWETCTGCNDPYTCGYRVCWWYETPSNTEQAAQYRGRQAKTWYDWLAANIGAESSIPEETPEPKTGGDEKTWPPEVCRKGDVGRHVMLLQAVLNCRGYGCRIDGIFGGETERQLQRWQADSRKIADANGICTDLAWESLLSLEE